MELATRLGKRLGSKRLAEIVLVDYRMTHLWKPLLHEVAAGTLLTHEDEVHYLVQAFHHHFKLRLGKMDLLNRKEHNIDLAPSVDRHGREFARRRTLHYDTLVIATGSQCNDFGISGVAEHCHFLDHHDQALAFNENLLRNYYLAQTGGESLRPGQLHVAIAGAGATGVELAAELHNATRQLVEYGLDRIQAERDVKITLIEAADRLLPALPERLSVQAENQLQALGIKLLKNCRITGADAEGYTIGEGENARTVSAELKVWAAGIKAPDFLKDLDGLESNRINQLVVKETLQTTRDPDVFAIGDSAQFTMPGAERPVPPRAMVAYQQASLLADNLCRRVRGEPLQPYRYVDYGSLINLSRYATVGNLMGNFMHKFNPNIFVEGLLAKLFYLSLYKRHQISLQGLPRVAMRTVSDLLTRKGKPLVKLH